MTLEQYLIQPKHEQERIKQAFITKYGFHAYSEYEGPKWDNFVKYLKSLYPSEPTHKQ